MMRPLQRLGLIAALLACAAPAAAWQPATRVRMADDAVKLLPASLRLAMGGYHQELLRGVLGPMTAEGRPEHLPPWDGGTLDATIEQRAAALRTALHDERSFGTIVRDFGELAHFVMDAGYPPGVGHDTSAARYENFGRFCQSRREKFPLVFYGHDEEHLAARDFLGFARAVIERAAAEDVALARAYTAAGDPPDPAAFDDRSIPFAVASLSYSRAVTDVVRAWLAVWEAAGGDMGHTPYRSRHNTTKP